MIRWKLTASTESLDDIGKAYEALENDSDETRFSPNPLMDPEEKLRVESDTEDEGTSQRVPCADTARVGTEDLGWTQTEVQINPDQNNFGLSNTLYHTEEMGWSETQIYPNYDHEFKEPHPNAPSAEQAEKDVIYLQINDPSNGSSQWYQLSNDASQSFWSQSCMVLPQQTNYQVTQDPAQELVTEKESEATNTLKSASDFVDSSMLFCSQDMPKFDVDDIIASLEAINILDPHDADNILSELSIEGMKPLPTTPAVPHWGRGRGKVRPRSCPRPGATARAPVNRSQSHGDSGTQPRKRSHSRARTTTQTPSSNPSPLKKSRKLCDDHSGPMYSRIKELRFLMKDIVAGQARAPSVREAESMRDEVHGILSALAAHRESRCGRAVASRREQAMQAAEKLIHQLQILLLDGDSYPSYIEKTQTQLEWISVFERADRRQTQTTSAPGSCGDRTQPQHAPEPIEPREDRGPRKNRNRSKGRSKKVSRSHKNQASMESTTKGNVGDPKIKHAKSMSRPASADLITTSTPLLPHILATDAGMADAAHPDTERDSTGTNYVVEEEEVPGNPLTTEKTSETHLQSQIKDNPLKSINESKKCLENSSEINIATDVYPSAPYNSPEQVSEKKLITSGMGFMIRDKEVANQTGYANNRHLLIEEIDSTPSISYNCKNKPLSSALPREVKEDEFIWKGGDLALNAILLPKKAELFSLTDLPSDFWDDPNAKIPESWVQELDW